MQKHRSELATVNVTIKLVGLLNKAKKKKKRLFGSPLPPAPNFWKLEKKDFTVQKYTAPNFQNSKNVFFFSLWEFWSVKTIFKLWLSTCLHSNTGLKLV